MPAPKGTRPPNAGKGRPKGAANKINQSLRDMILGALDDAGGQANPADYKFCASDTTNLAAPQKRRRALKPAYGLNPNKVCLSEQVICCVKFAAC
jgi:hypothetical protein